MLTVKRLRDLLHYDPATGVFVWLMNRGGTAWKGSIAGSTIAHGYRLIKVDRHLYGAGPLAWLYMTGEWPSDDVDHRDLDKDNNRWGNLRKATRPQNIQNTRVRKNNLTGLKGVTRHKECKGYYIARITVGKERRYLGFFDCPAAAHLAYAVAADKHFGEFART
jgi:hypothetical protein